MGDRATAGTIRQTSAGFLYESYPLNSPDLYDTAFGIASRNELRPGDHYNILFGFPGPSLLILLHNTNLNPSL